MTRSGRPQMFDDLLIGASKGLFQDTKDGMRSGYLLLTFAQSLLQRLPRVEGNYTTPAECVAGADRFLTLGDALHHPPLHFSRQGFSLNL